MSLLLAFFFSALQIKYISAAGAGGHSKCSVVKLYPQVFLEIKIENVSYYDVYAMYKNQTGYEELFHSVQLSLDYAYNQSYGYNSHIGNFLAKCKITLSKLYSSDGSDYSSYGDASSPTDAASDYQAPSTYTEDTHAANNDSSNYDSHAHEDHEHDSDEVYDGVLIHFDMEALDREYKAKIETLFGKKYFKAMLIYEYEHYFHEFHVSNYAHLYIKEIRVLDTATPVEERLKGFGIMIAFICGVFTVSGSVIFFYNRTEKHQKHLKQIADEFGFEDVAEVGQITHFKIF